MLPTTKISFSSTRPPPSYRESARLEAQLSREQLLEIRLRALERELRSQRDVHEKHDAREHSLDQRERLIREKEENNIELSVRNEIDVDYRIMMFVSAAIYTGILIGATFIINQKRGSKDGNCSEPIGLGSWIVLITCFTFLINFKLSYGLRYLARCSSRHSWARLAAALCIYALPPAMLIITPLLAMAMQTVCAINQ
ncbi:hypothetical protein NU195Hw_g1496t1 [Hortaea werneckii]